MHNACMLFSNVEIINANLFTRKLAKAENDLHCGTTDFLPLNVDFINENSSVANPVLVLLCCLRCDI